MSKPKGTQWLSTRFYKRLRKLNDKKSVSKRELLGLYFDLYELFMAIAEENRKDEMVDAMMGSMVPMFKLSSEEFDEVVKRDRKGSASKQKDKEIEKHAGQYL